jgi:hypothetical protein
MARPIHREWLTQKDTLCPCCGTTTQVTVEHDTKPPPKFCKACRALHEEGFSKSEVVTGEERKLNSRARSWKAKPTNLSTYRPGDPRFSEIASRVTPIWQIKNVSLPPNDSIDVGY